MRRNQAIPRDSDKQDQRRKLCTHVLSPRTSKLPAIISLNLYSTTTTATTPRRTISDATAFVKYACLLCACSYVYNDKESLCCALEHRTVPSSQRNTWARTSPPWTRQTARFSRRCKCINGDVNRFVAIRSFALDKLSAETVPNPDERKSFRGIRHSQKENKHNFARHFSQ